MPIKTKRLATQRGHRGSLAEPFRCKNSAPTAQPLPFHDKQLAYHSAINL
jgi:hypothetical protein